jgi:hypothetical protein
MLFDVLANILKTKSLKLYEEHIKSENFKDAAAFMIRRYLTMHPNPAVQNIVLDNFMSLERMSDTQLYRWLIYAVPRQNTTFIKYIR